MSLSTNLICCTWTLALFAISSCNVALTTSRSINEEDLLEKLEDIPECGMRPICTIYPLVCRQFTSTLMRGFSPAEVPFIARVTVVQTSSSNNNETIECVAVVLSQGDLAINAKCFRQLAEKSDELVVNWDWSNVSSPRRLDPVTANHDFDKFAIVSTSANNESVIIDKQAACVESVPLFKFDGIVCGFPVGDTTELSCRTLEVSNVESFEISPIQSVSVEDLKGGAAVFRRDAVGEDVENWRLIGFTDSDGKILTLSKDDCAAIYNDTQNRIQCLPDALLNSNLTLTTFADEISKKFNSLTMSSEDDGSSSSILFPTLIFGGILILAVLLCCFMARKSARSNGYNSI